MKRSFRSATSVVALSTALLIGSSGAAIAAADTGASDSASGSSPSSTESPSGNENLSSSSSPDSPENNSAQSPAVDGDSDGAGAAEDRAAEFSAAEDLAAEDFATEDIAAEDDAAEGSVAGGGDSGGGAATADIVDISASEDAAAVGATEAAASVASVSEGDQPNRDQAIQQVSSAATESEVVGSSQAIESEAFQPAVSSSDRAGSGITLAPSTMVALSEIAVATSPMVRTATSEAPADQDSFAGSLEPTALEPTAATRPPTLAEAFATVTTTMESLGNTVTTVVVSLGDTVATVAISLGSAAFAVPQAIWALPVSPTPISDVISLVETVLASMAKSTTAVLGFPANVVAQLRSEVDGTAAPAVIGDLSGHRLDMVTDLSVLEDMPAVAPTSFSVPGLQSPVEIVEAVSGFAFVPAAVAAAFSAPLKTLPTSLPAGAGEYQSLFDRAFGAMLVPLSLWALATGAFPGLIGLLVVFGAGARVGYRQAKAGFALRMVGLARFAGSGPMGVVRSGQLVELHQRGLRIAGPQYRLGDQVA